MNTYGKIPKTLIKVCERLNEEMGDEVVVEIGNEPDNADEGYRNDYWIHLNPMYNSVAMGTSAIHEPTMADCLRVMKLGIEKRR